MDRQLIDYLPYVVRDVDAFRAITAGEQPEFELVWDNVDWIMMNQYIPTADAYGLSRWESMLGIVPKGTDTLDERRFRILLRLMEQLPYTITRLRLLLEEMCGKGVTSADIEEGTYILNVIVWLKSRVNMPDVMDMLHRIVPVNLVLKVTERIIRKYRMTLNFNFGGAVGQEIVAQPVGEDREIQQLIPLTEGGYGLTHTYTQPAPVKKQVEADFILTPAAATGAEQQSPVLPEERTVQDTAVSARGIYYRTHIKTKRVKED